MTSTIILDLIKRPEKINKQLGKVYKTVSTHIEAPLADKYKIMCQRLGTTANDLLLHHIKEDLATYEKVKGVIITKHE
ncbi:hypothetical protein Barb4_04014 [Bacteroidales bacterium Barb4]|nr:hypothetical protein Barb4_04014 [Bacteroidales bacterium Barb4]